MTAQVLDRLSVELVVLRCRMGQAEAFTQLAERFDAPARYFVRRMLGSSQDMEDVVQELWLTVIRELPRLAAGAAFTTWFYRIARNKAVDRIRRSQKLERCDTDGLESAAEQTQPESEFGAEDAVAVHRGLDAIAPLHREVLLLRFLENLSYEQIAVVTGCSIGTVRSRLYHAKRGLRRAMEHAHVK